MINQCYCGGTVYSATVEVAAFNSVVAVPGYKCTMCSEEFLDAEVSEHIDEQFKWYEAYDLTAEPIMDRPGVWRIDDCGCARYDDGRSSKMWELWMCKECGKHFQAFIEEALPVNYTPLSIPIASSD